jgi:hypothetical protein
MYLHQVDHIIVENGFIFQYGMVSPSLHLAIAITLNKTIQNKSIVLLEIRV